MSSSATRDPRDEAIDTFAEIARALAEQHGLAETLQRVVDLAARTVPGAEHAAVSLVRRRREVETVASTSELPPRVDAVQYETGQGPCLDAIWEQETVEVADLSTTDRWPQFAQLAADLGVLSMAAFRLFVEEDTAGALNLYSSVPAAFTQQSLAVGHVFAAHAALAYSHEMQVQVLESAVDGRTVIGQAQGILMAQRRINADEAFGLLRQASNDRNLKLREVAQHVVDSGALESAG